MKLFYVGTVCDINNYEKILKKCKVKPTVANIVFESALLEGFYQNGIKTEIVTSPMIPNYHISKLLCWGRKTEKLSCGYVCNWLRTFNIIFFKQITRKIDGRRALKKWLRSNVGEDCVVLSYGISPFLGKDIISLSKKFGATSCAIVPDLPRDMFLNTSKGTIKAWLKRQYIKPVIKFQGQYDKYIYLTEAMSCVINPCKPFIVIEGVLDASMSNKTTLPVNKADPRVIMYAGGLNENFGVINLIEAFEKADIPNTELWLFGGGNIIKKIRSYAENNKKIKLFGRKSRDDILKYEKQATLLVNPRNIQDEYTKFSFPSKTIEYMYSGTPVLTTRLKGIPKEYFKYVYSVDNNAPETLAEALKKILSYSNEVLNSVGKDAQKFVREQKNSRVQARKIIDFLDKFAVKEQKDVF